MGYQRLTAQAEAAAKAFERLGVAYSRGQQRSRHRIGSWRSSTVLATKTHPKLVRERNRRRNKVARISRRKNRR